MTPAGPSRSRGRPRASTTLAGLLLVGCAVAASGPTVLPESDDVAGQARRVGALARGADVVYLGEDHDNPSHHERQRAALAALVAAGARPAVGFEMLPEEMQPEVDQLVRGAAGPAELARSLAWAERGWPDFAWYWPLFDLARHHDLPVVALDLDPAVSRRIAREGLASLGGRGEVLRSALPPDAGREAAIGRTLQAAHCDLLPMSRIPSMVESWHARNVTMARHIAAALDRGRPVVVIAGRGHQGPGGIPGQLEALRPGTRQLVVDMVEARPGADPGPTAGDGPAAVVWISPPVTRPDPCELMRRQLPPAR